MLQLRNVPKDLNRWKVKKITENNSAAKRLIKYQLDKSV